MIRKELMELAERIEAADGLGPNMAAEALRALRSSFAAEAAADKIAEDITSSSDALVELVNVALPGWYFTIHGRARHSPEAWSCSLRRSDVLDDDEILGSGAGRSLGQAILAAVIRVGALR